MRLFKNPKETFLDIVCLLYIFLLVYAAMNKGLDFENFKIELGQSPLLSAFADWVSWMVLIVEFLIALLLIFRRTRIMALYAGFALMTMFSVYIYVILNYGSFVPCSCGGVLEKMSWKQHLVFNIVFVLLGGSALWLNHPKDNSGRKKIVSYPVQLLLTVLGSSAIVVLIFLYSEKIMHYENPFIRRYPQHPAMYEKHLDLKYNSYYLAGHSGGRVYLANYTAPLLLNSVDKDLNSIKTEKIIFNPGKKVPFQRTNISVRGSYFYLKDGSVPTIFRGNTTNWKLNHEMQGVPYFTLALPMDSSSIAFRSNTHKNLANILGVFNENQQPQTKFNNTLLEQQIDGVFDTDGILLYSEELQKQIYLYFYRNQYIIAGKDGKLIKRGQTIDTVSKARIKVAYLDKQRRMKAPPLIVNSAAAVYRNLLFVNSKIKGRFEDDDLWKEASIIDVYDINKNAYLMSLAIYNIGDEKLKGFLVADDRIYALIGNQLAVYKFRPILQKEIK